MDSMIIFISHLRRARQAMIVGRSALSERWRLAGPRGSASGPLEVAGLVFSRRWNNSAPRFPTA